jgi:methylmalonyl-CoA mutase N-terminal domain/subunit
MPETKESSSPAEVEQERWEEETLKPALDKVPERKKSFQTVSLEEVERLYTPADTSDLDFNRDISFPGEFPYTRGIHPTGYRGKLWTMRQFAGFSTPEETNARFKYLMAQGQTGLSVAYDLPTLMGYDADSPLSEGEVGKCGVAVSSLADLEVLFDCIGKINVNEFSTYVAVRRDVADRALRGLNAGKVKGKSVKARRL